VDQTLPPTDTVVAVVVTYNRAELLACCLDALAAQTRRPDAVVVVDNASTDGSGEVADAHAVSTEVVHLHRNVGGAGGFCAGIARAVLHHDADRVWVMDDDTIPTPTALEALLDAADAYPGRAAVLSSRAVWTDGRDHPMNAQRTRMGVDARELAEAACAGARPIRTASYVSALLGAEEIRRLGLPNAEYFIWSDDFEHTGRLLRDGHGLHVPGSVVEHRTKTFANAQASPGGRFYYDVRNRLWALLRTDSFTTKEKILHGGRSLVGWLGQMLRHPDLWPIARQGVVDALSHGPRASATVLAADPEIAEDVRAVEKAAG
jgi:rhamnopyranosyl-N-acetylglucosaminyl-diphospho-decaprenol beta-1,3/1,4-galactofuranosyltransferase